MENKEPRVFKTLVHKETGEIVAIINSGEWGEYKVSKDHCAVYDEPITKEELSQEYEIDLSKYDLEECIVLKKIEYERLKGENK